MTGRRPEKLADVQIGDEVLVVVGREKVPGVITRIGRMYIYASRVFGEGGPFAGKPWGGEVKCTKDGHSVVRYGSGEWMRTYAEQVAQDRRREIESALRDAGIDFRGTDRYTLEQLEQVLAILVPGDTL